MINIRNIMKRNKEKKQNREKDQCTVKSFQNIIMFFLL